MRNADTSEVTSKVAPPRVEGAAARAEVIGAVAVGAGVGVAVGVVAVLLLVRVLPLVLREITSVLQFISISGLCVC